MVQKPDGNFITVDALEVSQQQMPAVVVPAQPIPWKKVAVIGGVALALAAALWMMSNSKRRSDTAPGTALASMPVKIPAAMESLIPPPLLGIVGFAVTF